MKLDVEIVDIALLKFDENNARKHNETNLVAIANSLNTFGQRKPIVVTKDNVVIAGNGTMEAALRLGWEEISIVRVPDDWTTDTIKAFALADNKTAELASWDADILLTQLEELKINNWDIDDLGFKDFAVKEDKEIDTDTKDIGERYEVVIECKDENEQTALLLRLSEEGLKVRAIVI